MVIVVKWQKPREIIVVIEIQLEAECQKQIMEIILVNQLEVELQMHLIVAKLMGASPQMLDTVVTNLMESK